MVSAPAAVLEKLQAAINAHDLDALVSCFDPGVESKQPAHPARDFTGSDQVRQNWAKILGGVPDLSARLLRHVVQDDTVWAEWAWSGKSRNGQPFEMRGVTLLVTGEEAFKGVTFYMEPMENAGSDVGASITQLVGRPS